MGINNPEDEDAVTWAHRAGLETVDSTHGERTTASSDVGLQPQRPSKPSSTIQKLVQHSRYLHKLRDVEEKQKSVTADATKLPSELKRSRLFKKFLREAEPLGFRKTVDIAQDDQNIQIHTAYDTKSWDVPKPEVWQPGPLKVAFTFYAKLLDPKIATGSYYPTFDAIERAARTCTFTEALAFAWDFNIVPNMLSRGDLRYAFAYVNRSKEDYIKELTYEQFEEFLSRVALIVYEDTPPESEAQKLLKESIVMDSEGNPIFCRKTGGEPKETLPMPDFHKKTSWKSSLEILAEQTKVEPMTPAGKVKKFLRDVGLNSLEYVKYIIESKGKTTSGRLNGTIKLNSPREDDEDVASQRLLRKRDGAMCDYSAPELMAKRNRCRAQFSQSLVKPWKSLREFKSNDNIWKGFHAPTLYLGRSFVGRHHRFRILVRNPMRNAITIECEPHGCGFLTLEYVRAPIAAGLTVTITVDSHIVDEGEKSGYIKIKWRVYKTEVSARKHSAQAAADVDAGRSIVPVYAVGLNPDKPGNEDAEKTCPVDEFQKACTEPCPRYYLAPDHAVHKFEKPATNGEWQRAQLGYLSGRATRDRPRTILPRPGTGTMAIQKEMAKQPTLRQDTTTTSDQQTTGSQREGDSGSSRLKLPLEKI